MDKAEYVFYKLAQETKYNSEYYNNVLKDTVPHPDAEEYFKGMYLPNKKINLGDNVYADMTTASKYSLDNYNYDQGIGLAKHLGEIGVPFKYDEKISKDKNSKVYKDTRNEAYSTARLGNLSGIPAGDLEEYGLKARKLNLPFGSKVRVGSKEYNELRDKLPFYIPEVRSKDKNGDIWYHVQNTTKPSKNNTFNNYSAGNYT